MLCYLQGLTYAAAAEQLALSEIALRGRLDRARKRLRRRLIQRGLPALAWFVVDGVAGQTHAAVPLSLIHSTIRIGLGFVAGNTAATLARGVLNSMLLNKLRVVTVLLAFGFGGSTWAWHAYAAANEGKGQTNQSPQVPIVQLINPQVRNIVRVVGEPSYIEAFDRSSVFPKLTAHIKEWKVDIGDKVKKGQTLATLLAPDLEEEFKTRQATVVLGRERTAAAKEMVKVVQSDLKAAEARLNAAKLALTKNQAEVHRWEVEVTRLRREVDRGVVDPAVLAESRNQLTASSAAREAAKAAIEQVEAELLARRAAVAKAQVDVQVAEADLKVAQSEEKRLAAQIGYLTLSAPFDGLIVARNANTFDLVQPNPGPPPIYVVDKIDRVRVFVGIAEQLAPYVRIGTKASVVVKAYRDEPIAASLVRTSWTLNVKSRMLRAEIDLPNPGNHLLPGMYAYAEVTIERPGVKALPLTAIRRTGDQSYCWTYENGHAVRMAIETGLSDGQWIEVTRRRCMGCNRCVMDTDQRLGTGHAGRSGWPPRWRPGGGIAGRQSSGLATNPDPAGCLRRMDASVPGVPLTAYRSFRQSRPVAVVDPSIYIHDIDRVEANGLRR